MIKEYWDENPLPVPGIASPRNKYSRQVKGVTVDVYDVLKAFDVTCPALQHAAKKVLCAGLRGHKDTLKDIREAIEALGRAEQLNAE